MSSAATQMKTLLVAFAFLKGISDTPSVFKHLSAFLSFSDCVSLLFHAAIMGLNSFINDNYCSKGHTV